MPTKVTGRTHPVPDVDDIVTAVQALFEKQGVILDEDHAEAKRELSRCKAWQCSKKKRIRKRMREVPQKVQKAQGSLTEVIDQVYTPVSGAIGELMETRRLGWQDFARQIGVTHDKITAQLGMKEWDSAGARQYKAALPTQLKALKELQSMSESSAVTCEQVALMNSAVFELIKQATDLVNRELTNTQVVPAPPEWLSHMAMWDTRCFERSDKGASMTNALTSFMDELSTPASEWGGTAQNLTASLQEVVTTGSNLGPNGEWPTSVAKVTPEASAVSLAALQQRLNAIAKQDIFPVDPQASGESGGSNPTG